LEVLQLLASGPPRIGEIVMGDFNADPLEPVVATMEGAGFRSAHKVANGFEPAVTYPTPLLEGAQRPRIERCVDYIWFRGDLSVTRSGLAFDRPSSVDPKVYPSDHFGLYADLVFRE
jgi:endonuclease/exonuclease/phosphatase family metal-dependent hydrolase